MPLQLSAITEATAQLIATAMLRLDTPGAGFTDITGHVASFLAQIGAGEGTLLIFLRHTSASLTIQENADPDVQTDLISALDRLAPFASPREISSRSANDSPLRRTLPPIAHASARASHSRRITYPKIP